jgi:hypothetical protein
VSFGLNSKRRLIIWIIPLDLSRDRQTVGCILEILDLSMFDLFFEATDDILIEEIVENSI